MYQGADHQLYEVHLQACVGQHGSVTKAEGPPATEQGAVSRRRLSFFAQLQRPVQVPLFKLAFGPRLKSLNCPTGSCNVSTGMHSCSDMSQLFCAQGPACSPLKRGILL